MMNAHVYRTLFGVCCFLWMGMMAGCGGDAASDGRIDTPEEMEADLADQQEMVKEQMGQ